MPYNEDGETWDAAYDRYEDGMAENKPGHKKLADYNLPTWVRHPLTHPFSGIFMDATKYAYAACQGTMDGLSNHMMWNPAHIAAAFGDMEMLESCSAAELNGQNINGETPANYAVQYGCPWVLQWLVEHGCDTTTPNHEGCTPEDCISNNGRLHAVEVEALNAAIKGELTDKKNVQAQEYKLKRWRAEGLDAGVEEWLDFNKLKQRAFMYKTGDYEMPYPLPTDAEVRARVDLPMPSVKRPPIKAKPALPVGLLFPGQGSQMVGMLKEVLHMPAVEKMLSKAEEILGWSVKDLCLNGPEDKLMQTEYCQPVMFVAGLCAVEKMKETMKESVERCQAVAGFSLGEYTALCVAEVLSFEDGLHLVKIRAEAMQKAAEVRQGKMISVAGLEKGKVDSLCEQAVSEALEPDPVCSVANFMWSTGFSVAGSAKTADRLEALAKEAKALQAKEVKAGGAFHSKLMKPAEEELARAIDDCLPKMQPPRCSVYFNRTGKRVVAGTDPANFVNLMKEQLTNTVLWEHSVKQMIMDGVKDFYECGPNKQLKAMLKRIDQDAFKRTENMSV
mmetsp:Transcript_839/g.1861  ORF Transcript_839/g.1861 Transcript_839/m.1861 type:complete len:560 (-) Transcript_839:37-1716(-)|eukprot:CAMPEP_0178440672 /NCGR_PEP_ID=MMETSP0689_2-20121128/36928_1 /TAXON_ID=160604 /ORGANISM="Amphidinium massartii, Strain CS-259" /LENGTH=559 /DNA_ID=CAMNT_0020063511 /DNA_START=51 /DNA_END=1730 /DNA_ORIENTATION=+